MKDESSSSLIPSLDEILKDIGEYLFEIRHYRREKLSSVCSSVGITHSVLSQIEHGKYTSLSFKLLVKLAEYYKIKPEIILQSSRDKEKIKDRVMNIIELNLS